MNIFTKTLIVLSLAMLSSAIVSTVQGIEPLGIAEQYRFIHFLEDDQTNLNKYDADEYNCLDYALNLWENATKEGYSIAIVNIAACSSYPDGHYVVAYTVAGNGWVVVEPQNDAVITDTLQADGVAENITMIDPWNMQRTDQMTLKLTKSSILAAATV